MKENKNTWLVVRVALVVLAFFQANYFLDSFVEGFTKPAWLFFFEAMIIAAISVFAIASFLLPNKASGEKWSRPSWFINPFNVRQIFIFFDFASYYIFSLSLGCLFIGLLRNPKNWLWELPMSIGLGIFLGVRAVLFIFSDRFEMD